MAAGNAEIVKLKSTKSTHIYYTRKNKKQNPEKLERKKYDPIVRQHVVYKEHK